MVDIKTCEEIKAMSEPELRQYGYDLIMSLTEEERTDLLRKYKERKDSVLA